MTQHPQSRDGRFAVTDNATDDSREIVEFATADEFAAWLEASHASSDGIWLKIAKKGAETGTVNYAEALESALR